MGGRFEAALSIGVMPVDGAAELCRARVRPSGVYILDDVVRLERAGRREGLGAPTLREARDILERRGDRILETITPTPAQTARLNAGLYATLALNAARLGDAHPRLRPALRAFLKRQREANRILIGPLRPTLWMVRRVE